MASTITPLSKDTYVINYHKDPIGGFYVKFLTEKHTVHTDIQTDRQTPDKTTALGEVMKNRVKSLVPD